MVRATCEVTICQPDFEIKFGEDMDLFNSAGFDLPQLHLGNVSDDSPPDTPCPNGATLSLAPFADVFLDSFAKAADPRESDWDYVEVDPKASNAAVMWNVEHAAQDPSCKLVAAAIPSAASSVSSLDLSLSASSSPLFMDLFAAEDISSDDDIFREFSGKRKGPAMESVDAKKAKARQTRDALTAETQMRLLSSSGGSDSKRLTHNVLERKRRNDLKASYQELRESIPELVHQERAPTAQILSKGVEYIEYLKKNDASMMAAITALRADIERNKAMIVAAGQTPNV
jgi:hypothetical protein